MPAPWARGAQCRIIGELHGQTTVNVLHFATNTVVNDGPDFDALLLQLVEAMRDCVIETLLPAVTSNWMFVRCEAVGIYPTRTDPIVATGVPENVGELGVTSVSFAASLINVRSGVGGRNGRGKMFLPPAGEAETTDSVLDGPTLVLLAAFAACVAAKFMGAAKTTDWDFGVFSRKLGGNNAANFDAGFHTAKSLNPVADAARMGSRKLKRGI